MKIPFLILLINLLTVAAAVQAAEAPAITELEAQVAATESAFAGTMAERDFDAFTEFLSAEAVFFSGTEVLRGREAVARAWQPFFADPAAPFSWQPETVEVLDSGQLALSSGPVFDPSGRKTGTFTSIWRKEATGQWKIVFDKGNQACSD